MTQSTDTFKQLINTIEQQAKYKKPIAFGIARVDRGQMHAEKILQATYPVANWNENFGSAAVFIDALQKSGHTVDFSATEQVFPLSDDFLAHCLEAFSPFLNEAKDDAHKNVQLIKQLANPSYSDDLDVDNFHIVLLFEDSDPQSVEAVYLKLYALSNGKAPLRSVNLNGAFGKLHNSAWVGNTPIELDWLRANEIALKINNEYPEISMVDKFPRYLSHLIPADNTRILDTSRVRFGAHLAAGTTVMPGASYINFNAGTLGPVMVEGRISSSAIVGAGSDVGGGASILGVLSGTDGEPISIGENTLLGANSCTGTSLGDGCIVDAGVTILAGTKVSLEAKDMDALQQANPSIAFKEIMKGADFVGANGVHFRINSLNGKVVAKRSSREVKLNAELH